MTGWGVLLSFCLNFTWGLERKGSQIKAEKGTPISRSQVKVKSHRALQFSTAGFALPLNLIG